MKWKIFFWADLPAVIMYVGGSIFLGYHFHGKMAVVITKVEYARHLIFILLIIIIGLLISYHASKKFSKRNENNENGKNDT